MSTAQRLVKSTSYLTASRLSGDLIYFIFYVLLSRAFGREGIGAYAFALELASTLFIVADYGLSVYLVRELSRKRERLPQYLGAFILLKLAFTALAALALALVSPAMRLDGRALSVLAVIGCAQAVYYGGELFKAAFAAHERLSEVAFAEFLYKGGVFLLGSLFLALRWPLEWVLGAFLLSAVVYLSTLLVLARVRLGLALSLHWDAAIAREALRGAFPFFLSALLMDLHFSAAVIMIRLMHGEEACGIFSVAGKLLSAFSVAVLFYRVSLFPALSRLHHESPEEYRHLYRNSFKYVFLVFVPAAVFAGAGAPSIIHTIFGREFDASIAVLQVLSPAVLLIALRHLLVATLGSIHAQGRLVRYQGLGVLTGVVAGLALIPRWQAVGAAAAYGLAELVAVACAALDVSRTVERLPWARLLWKPLIASAAMGAVVLLLGGASLTVVFPAAVASCVVALLLTGGLRKDEVAFVKDALRPRLRGAYP